MGDPTGQLNAALTLLKHDVPNVNSHLFPILLSENEQSLHSSL